MVFDNTMLEHQVKKMQVTILSLCLLGLKYVNFKKCTVLYVIYCSTLNISLFKQPVISIDMIQAVLRGTRTNTCLDENPSSHPDIWL